VTELLGADILGIARRLASTLSGPSGPRLGDDAVLQAHLQRFQRLLARELDFQASETAVPAVQLGAVIGYPAAVLELAAPSLPLASLSVLRDLIDGLDPATEEMTGDLRTNARRKARLLESVDAMPALLRFGQLARLTRELLDLRGRADGGARPDDWIAGPTAGLIVQRIDATLAMIRPR
jgi:hypothetical protein